MFTALCTAAIAGYLLGSLPFGYLVARANGVNIFEHGSKNPGATNVRRVCGKRAGNTVFLLDALKGVAAAGWPLLLLWLSPDVRNFTFAGGALWAPEFAQAMAVVGLLSALIGHCFSCFTKFKGGKGVATAVGGVLVLMPISIVIGAAVWCATFFTLRYVSLASLLAAVSLPISAFFLGQPRLLVGMAAAIAILVIIRHRANITRLLNGTENRFAKKNQPAK
ncbi:MAG TPA: glycerol-3-phosphate 1-O-acyltransferase PlsY [Opitutaceae bacterium]|nr:glycerol-3-phosphate 1-O-acyltransferase PlsY [Opitutaceae bacterium]